MGSQMGSVLGSPTPSRYGSYELQHAPVQEESLMGTEGEWISLGSVHNPCTSGDALQVSWRQWFCKDQAGCQGIETQWILSRDSWLLKRVGEPQSPGTIAAVGCTLVKQDSRLGRQKTQRALLGRHQAQLGRLGRQKASDLLTSLSCASSGYRQCQHDVLGS